MLAVKADRVLESGRARRLLAVLVIAGAALVSLTAARRMSVTIDEFQTVPAGLAMLETGDYRFPKGTPPLSLLLPAVPAWLNGARVGEAAQEPSWSSWMLAHDFARRQGASFPAVVTAPRYVSAAVFALLLTLLFGYARSLYGERAALLAITVAGLCPNLLGHGSLLTPDIYLAAAVVGMLWSLDALLEAPSARRAAALGLCLGIAVSVKFTGLLFIPLLPALARGRRPWHLLGAVGLAWLVVHAVYSFDGAFSPVSRFAFESHLFQRLQAHLPGSLPVPLPFHFVRALDEQLAELPYPAYLLGDFNQHGFFFYYVVALAVKTPVATLALAAMAIVARRKLSPREWRYVTFAVTLLLVFSLARFKNIGVRYVLFVYPLLALWCARVVSLRPGWAARARAACLVFLCLECAMAWPDFIAFFNFASGGTRAGHRYLLDSNLDWGQGLIELRDFLDGREVSLAYAGRVRPELYGIRYETLKEGEAPTKELIAVSANLLYGRGYFVNGTSYWPRDRDAYAAYRSRAPLAVLGGSVYVYAR